MNKEHCEILKGGVEVWNEWREIDKSIQPDLSYADLSDMDLRGYNLTGANLYRTNLSRVRLAGANLYKAHIVGAKMEKADLCGGCMVKDSFSLSDLRGAGADLSPARPK